MLSFFPRSSRHLTEQVYFNFAKFLFKKQFWFWVLPNSWKWVREMKRQKLSLKLPAVFQENPKTLNKANSTTLYVRGRSISHVLIQQEMCFGSLSNACYTYSTRGSSLKQQGHLLVHETIIWSVLLFLEPQFKKWTSCCSKEYLKLRTETINSPGKGFTEIANQGRSRVIQLTDP